MRVLSFAFLFLFLSVLFAHAGLIVAPAEIDNGGLALLRWEGDPSSLVVARFRDRVFQLAPTEQGAVALLGADVELPPGEYPILAAVIDPRGETSFRQLELAVRDAERPVERLTLPPAMVTPREPEVIERIVRERTMLRELFERSEGPPRWSAFRRPVDDPVSSSFGRRRILNGEPRSPHAGVDFRSPKGTLVLASGRGRVALVDELFFTGRTVILDHGGGLYTLYAHLEDVACRPDQWLDRGEVLGSVGSSGRSTGPHLHWGVKLRGDRIDPLELVKLLGEQKPVARKSLDSNPAGLR